MRARQPRIAAASAGTCAGPGGALGGLDTSDVNDAEDDVLHKVHVMLHTRMDTIRVQAGLCSITTSNSSSSGRFFIDKTLTDAKFITIYSKIHLCIVK